MKMAFLIFPLLAIVFTFPFLIFQYRKYGSIPLIRIFIIYSFILYLLTVYFLVILPLPDKSQVVYNPRTIRLIPFSFIFDFLHETSFVITDVKTYFKALLEPCFYTVFFNLLMTVPFGMYLRYYFRCRLSKTIWLSFLLSLFFEITQLSGLYGIYPYPYRVFDVDDLIINTLGGTLGYFLIGCVIKYLPKRSDIDKMSIKAGENVSGLRRVVIFLLDIIIYLLISGLFFKNLLSSFIVYYIFIPQIFHGTIGTRFLKVKLYFLKKNSICYSLIYIFQQVYYIILPLGLLYYENVLLKTLSISTIYTFFIELILIFVIFHFYLINFVILLSKKKNFYDNLFSVTYLNMITKNKNYNIIN